MAKTVEEIFQEANKSLLQGKLQQAFELYIHAGRVAGDDPDLLLDVGLHFGSLGHQCYYKAVYPLAINAYWIALMLIPEKYQDNTHSSFEEFLEHRSIYSMLGKCYMELKQWEEAISVLEKAKDWDEFSGLDLDLYNTLGDLYFSLGRYDEGIKVFREFLNPKSYAHESGESDVYRAIDNIVWAYRKQNDPAGALAILADAFYYAYDLVDDISGICKKYLDLAETLGVENYKKALLGVIDNEMGNDPLIGDREPYGFCLDAFIRLANLYLNEKNFSEAEKYLEAAIWWRDDDPVALRSLVRLHTRRGDILQAERYLDRAKLIDPKSIYNWELTAELLLMKGDYLAARETAENGINQIKEKKEEFPDAPNVINEILVTLLLRKIDALVKLEQNEAALEELKNAREKFPKVETFYTYASVLLYLSNRPQEAKAVIDAAEKAGIPISERMRDIKNKVLSIIV